MELTGSHDLDFKASLEKWGTDDFGTAVYDDLEMHGFALPLDELCEAGGWADRENEVDFSVEDSEERDGSIIVTAEVWFTESAPTGCPDLPMREPRCGKLIVEIDTNTGLADVRPERAPQESRNLENY